MASEECQYCYYWKSKYSSDSRADCDKTGRYKKYNDKCDCGKFANK